PGPVDARSDFAVDRPVASAHHRPRMSKIANLPVLTMEPAAPRRAPAVLRPNPFLHIGSDRVYDPLTDRTLAEGEPGYAALRAVLAGAVAVDEMPGAEREALTRQGWLLSQDGDVSHRSLLKYVSLEAHTVCNQACYFCPVSIAPREDYFMPT